MTINNPSDPKKTSRRLNLFIGGPPPTGAAVFRPDGTIEHTPDTPEARHEWTVRKMTASINREPDNGEWYFERGNALFELGRFMEAIPDFSKLIELFPQWGNYYRLRGLCFYHANQPTQSLDDLRRYRELSNPLQREPEAIKILEELETARPE